MVKNTIFIDKSQLPLYCPQKNSELWSSHPKVYLTLEQGETQCPYCSTHYKLQQKENGNEKSSITPSSPFVNQPIKR